MLLDEILRHKFHEVAERKERVSLSQLQATALNLPASNNKFKQQLISDCRLPIKLIAEIKQRSPSAGILRKYLDAKALAMTYQMANATALAVVTEEHYFGTSLATLEDVKKVTTLPVLMKDFIVDEYQVWEAAVHRADAILIIACYLSRDQIQNYIDLARNLSLTPVVEVHTEADVDKVIQTDADIIGINNRNLYTFNVDIHRSLQLKILLPKDKITISESGIHTSFDVKLLKEGGLDAILVGEALLASIDVRKKIQEFFLFT